MIIEMNPRLTQGEYVFWSCADPVRARHAAAYALATFAEAEGLSLIVPIGRAAKLKIPVTTPMRQIVLSVYSALEGIGLTAAVATALTLQGIPCNVVAAFHHDYVFVPAGSAEAALTALRELQRKV